MDDILNERLVTLCARPADVNSGLIKLTILPEGITRSADQYAELAIWERLKIRDIRNFRIAVEQRAKSGKWTTYPLTFQWCSPTEYNP